MKWYVIAGEVSGDIYGGHIINRILKSDPGSEVRFWGGNQMLAESGNIVKHIKETAFMGFVEVVKNLRTIRSNMQLCKDDITEYQPDCIIFIDYPGFNLRIAEWAKSQQFTTAYYIAPKVWAWKENRVKKLKAFIDHLYVIFPFEVDYFAKHEIKANYFGSPLVNEINAYRSAHPSEQSKIVLMPGSRAQELKRHMPLMVEYAMAYPDEQFILPITQGFTKASLAAYSPQSIPDNIEVVNNSWEALNQARLGIIASGTATLEGMLFDVPQVVIYKANWLSYHIAKRVVKLKWISLVNIIANKEVVTELIQDKANIDDLEQTISHLQSPQSKVTDEYATIRTTLESSEDPIQKMVSDLIGKLES